MRYRLGYSAAGIGRLQAHPLAAPGTDYFHCHSLYLHKQKAPLNSSESRQKGFSGLGYASLFTSHLPRFTGF